VMLMAGSDGPGTAEDQDAGDVALAEVRGRWGAEYDIGPAPGGGLQAARRDGTGTLTAAGPDALWDAMTADHAERPAGQAAQRHAERQRLAELWLAGWLAGNPGGKAYQHPVDGTWRGSVPVDGERALSAPACDTLGELAEELALLPAAAAQVRLIEAEFAGWMARRWPDGTWRAYLPNRDPDKPPATTAKAASPDGLRDAIREATAKAAVPS